MTIICHRLILNLGDVVGLVKKCQPILSLFGLLLRDCQLMDKVHRRLFCLGLTDISTDRGATTKQLLAHDTLLFFLGQIFIQSNYTNGICQCFIVYRIAFQNSEFRIKNYLFTRNFSHPSLMKPTIWCAAAMPALMLASAVCAPIFLGVEK